MARKKPHQKTKKRTQDFYEAVPVAMIPPAALPKADLQVGELARLIGETAAQLKNLFSRLKLPRVQAPSSDQIRQIVQSGSIVIVRTSRRLRLFIVSATLKTSDVVLYYAQSIRFATRYVFETTASLTPSIAADAWGYARGARSALASRKARAIYLSLLAGGIFAGVVFGVVTATSTLNAYASYISSPTALLSKKKTGVTILDRNGKVLYEGYGAQDVSVAPLSNIPDNLVNATLAAEDPQFYHHAGFSWESTLRAAWVDVLSHGAVEGGSTLTQQLVKNALLTDTKSVWRKYQEILLSVDLERRYSKNQILDMYLNEIYYGEGASGVQAAAETYFHTNVQNLTLSQSALLAGLPLEPSELDPNVDLSAATGRRNYVLSRMYSLGYISKTDEQTALDQPLQLASADAPQPSSPAPVMVYAKQNNIQAPWFVFYVLDELRQQYGDDLVEQGGLTVKTTLDLNDENIAETAIQNHISALSGHNVTNGALVSLNPKTGDILAMVGSVDYNAPGWGNVNVTLATRQPGSSFKPIAYATAFEKGWNGATTVLDAPVCYPSGDGGQWCPQNYDLKFHGVVTLRHAIDNSLNVPSVKVLQFAGVPETLKTAHDMGITTLNDPSAYGLSLVLGSGDVRPLDMATVYATLDNNGVKVLPRSILEVTNRDGQNITKPDPNKPTQVLDPRIAYMLTNILSDAQSRLPEFPLNSPLTLDRPAAAKTGTTTDFRDNWTIGYTPQLATAVWVGNNDNTPMENVDGITGAAPIWHDYMEGALAGTPIMQFTQPAGVVLASVCTNGGLAQGFSTGITEVFIAGQLPTTQCDQNPNPTADTSSSPTPSPSDQPTSGDQTPSPDQTPTPTPQIEPPSPPAPAEPSQGFPFGN
jgi:1A family penicillin-binding protein